MIVSYNHEINNPLAIAMMALERVTSHRTDDLALDRVRKSLARIADVVQKIEKVGAGASVTLSEYSGTTKMLKLK